MVIDVFVWFFVLDYLFVFEECYEIIVWGIIFIVEDVF